MLLFWAKDSSNIQRCWSVDKKTEGKVEWRGLSRLWAGLKEMLGALSIDRETKHIWQTTFSCAYKRRTKLYLSYQHNYQAKNMLNKMLSDKNLAVTVFKKINLSYNQNFTGLPLFLFVLLNFSENLKIHGGRHLKWEKVPQNEKKWEESKILDGFTYSCPWLSPTYLYIVHHLFLHHQ